MAERRNVRGGAPSDRSPHEAADRPHRPDIWDRLDAERRRSGRTQREIIAPICPLLWWGSEAKRAGASPSSPSRRGRRDDRPARDPRCPDRASTCRSRPARRATSPTSKASVEATRPEGRHRSLRRRRAAEHPGRRRQAASRTATVSTVGSRVFPCSSPSGYHSLLILLFALIVSHATNATGAGRGRARTGVAGVAQLGVSRAEATATWFPGN